MKLSNPLLFALFFLIALRLDTRAYAYLDPGTGSMLIQMLLGGVAGVLVVGKLYWSRIKTFFHIGSPKDRSGDTASRSDAQ
jgi:hypothetical protein